jgi:hypothetical protein
LGGIKKKKMANFVRVERKRNGRTGREEKTG